MRWWPAPSRSTCGSTGAYIDDSDGVYKYMYIYIIIYILYRYICMYICVGGWDGEEGAYAQYVRIDRGACIVVDGATSGVSGV